MLDNACAMAGSMAGVVSPPTGDVVAHGIWLAVASCGRSAAWADELNAVPSSWPIPAAACAKAVALLALLPPTPPPAATQYKLGDLGRSLGAANRKSEDAREEMPHWFLLAYDRGAVRQSG